MLRDAHATGEGYLRSPRDGSLQDIVERILTLERDAGVCPDRRLGVSLGFHPFARQAGDAAAWGGEWIETRPSGPQGWWPADACTGALFGHLRHIGLAWACIGASAGEHVARLVAAARDEGLGIALRPAPDTLEVVEDSDPGGMTLESLPVLLDALIARRAGRPAARGESEVLRGLARVTDTELDAAVRWIVDARVTVVSLITAAARRASLRQVVHAPNLDVAAGVLPYHSDVARLRAPGALRTGGREASRHLDIPVLSREEERAASTGVEVVRGALRALLAAGADIRPGSGAPGVGLAPGLAQHEESELFRAGGASTEGEGAGG